ncbi:MAG: transcriptional repressor [Dehalococcoidia bacterium]|nr:transcriptional repressor [Dehalococcoidia bacterium]
MKRRTTRQRRAILEYLRGATSHPSASALHEVLRKDIPNISLGTVYRALGVLQEEGTIQELPYDDFSRYDARTDHHYHITCLACGRVADVEVAPALEEMTAHVQASRFKVVGHRLDFTGYCESCQDEVRQSPRGPGSPER